jgi:rubredoxin
MTASKPKCIGCGRIKSVQVVGEFFKCSACGVLFDSDPNEGSDHSDRNPAARLEREDRARAQRAQPRRNR